MPSEFDQLLHLTAEQPASGVLKYLNGFNGGTAKEQEVNQAEQQYYGTPNTQPGFVAHDDPNSMPGDVYNGLLDALKPTALGQGKIGNTLEPEMRAIISQRDDQRFIEDVGNQIQDYSDQNAKLRAQVQRQSVYATTTMDIGGQEWEIPLTLSGLSEDDIRALGTDVSRWPEDLRNTLEDRARDNLEAGYDPFGNPIDQQQNQGQQEDLGLYDDLPGSLK